jgi:seryl-tRNA synthetase
MIDIELIRSDLERVKLALSKRVDDLDLESILALDRRRREMQRDLEAKRAKRNQTAKEVGRLRASGAPTAELEQLATALRDQIDAIDPVLAALDRQLEDLLARLPNLPDDRVPAGGKANNQVVRTWGEPPPAFDGFVDHVELCTRLDLIDYERGTKLGGSGFWLYTGMGAGLEWALMNFFCREHFTDGYRFMLPPHILVEECGFTAGQFPKFRDDVFHIADGDRKRFLLPTSETAILNVYRDEIIPFEQLPIKAFAYTPCYRRESGSHRAEERGTIRGHQFNKVEMFQFVAPEHGEAAFDELVKKTERLVEKLGLHYQTSLLAAQDASPSMAITYDVEVWLPSIGVYKEVSSVSWAKDFQARRAKIRTRRPESKKSELVHTLNASGLATSRIFPAIVEQHQQPDGSLRVPAPLQEWVGTDVIRPTRSR